MWHLLYFSLYLMMLPLNPVMFLSPMLCLFYLFFLEQPFCLVSSYSGQLSPHAESISWTSHISCSPPECFWFMCTCSVTTHWWLIKGLGFVLYSLVGIVLLILI
jgi:hypothetical protein